METSYRMYEDITLKALCDSAKSNRKTILKELCKLKGESFIAKNLKEKDFTEVEKRIEAMNISTSSKRSYKWTVKQIRDEVLRDTAIIQKPISQQKTASTTSFEELPSFEKLGKCEFRQTNSRRLIVCRHKNPLIKTDNLTSETCQLCETLIKEMAQYQKMLGVKPQLREYKALKLIKQKLQVKDAEIDSITRSRDHYKKEIEKRFSDEKNAINHNQQLQDTLNSERSEKQRLIDESTKMKAENESLKTEKRNLQEIAKRIRSLKIRCPMTNRVVSVAEQCCKKCDDFMQCSEYGKLLYVD